MSKEVAHTRTAEGRCNGTSGEVHCVTIVYQDEKGLTRNSADNLLHTCGACKACGKDGHWAADCPEKGVVYYVCGFLFAGGNVALIKKQRPSWQRGRFNGIGGHIEPGETDKQAMQREFEEETGYLIAEDRWQLFCKLLGKRGEDRYCVHFFYAQATPETDPRPVLQTTTDEEVVWLPLEQVGVNNCMVNLSWLIPMAKSMVNENAASYSVIEVQRVDPEDILPSRY